MSRRALLLVPAMLLVLPAGVWAEVEEIPCIYDIIDGTTEDFESLYGTHDPVNDVLVNHDMIAIPNMSTTTFVSWVVGNDCAPIGGQAGFNQGFRIETTGDPWDAIGMSAIGTMLYQDRTFNFYAYDENDQLLGSVTKIFDGGYDQDSYNAGAVFLGLSSSTTPIYAIEMTADNGNVGWDNVTYHHWTASECVGDIDGDGDTDHSDLGELLAAWCTQEGDPSWNPNADLDGDGHVGHGDLGILLADWGCTP